MHAVSRDTTSFPSPCIYLQLDGQQKLADGPGPAANGAAPMDVSSGTDAANGAAATGAPAPPPPPPMGGEGAEDADEDGEENGNDDEPEPQEVRLVPLGLEGEALSASLDKLFEVLSECAALNPDDGDELDDDDEYGEDSDDGGAALLLAASQGAEGFIGDPQAMLQAATPAQLAMLERYDAMLDASSVETGVGALQVDNADGRFDDPEEEAGAPARQ